MPGHTTSPAAPEDSDKRTESRVEFRVPRIEDGSTLWRIARDSQVLDQNAPYTYLLWCRDFAQTSVVATVDGEVGGFVTGFIRPDHPEIVLVWQVAVDERHRGQRLARRMLDALADRVGERSVRRMDTTITLDNEPSIRLFTSFAEARGAPIEREPLFTAEMFPDGHEAEVLFRIGPW
jgi:diaminobutyrate acetyltransferase